jgi:hypothetical protein
MEVSVTATTLLDRPIDLASASRPVLAIVDLNHPEDTVLARSALAAEALGCQVMVVLVAPRVGLSTDAALVARAHQRIGEERDEILAAFHQHIPHLAGPAEFVWYSLRPIGSPVEQAYRAAKRVIRRYDARAALLPPHLESVSCGPSNAGELGA